MRRPYWRRSKAAWRLFCRAKARQLLRGYIEEEIAAQGADPRREAAQLRARLTQIDQQANVLLEGLSLETKGFIDAKLRELAAEKRRHTRRLEELEAAPYEPIDAAAVLRDGMAALRDLPGLLESAHLEERKQLVNAFIAGVTVQPDERRLDLQVRALPVLDHNSSVGVVAGARYEPLQMNLKPPTRFIAVGRGLRLVA